MVKKKKAEPLYDQLHNHHFIGDKNHSFRQHVFTDLDVCFKILYLKCHPFTQGRRDG